MMSADDDGFHNFAYNCKLTRLLSRGSVFAPSSILLMLAAFQVDIRLPQVKGRLKKADGG